MDEEDNSELADVVGKSTVTEETIGADPRISAKEELEVINLSSDPASKDQFPSVHPYQPQKEHD